MGAGSVTFAQTAQLGVYRVEAKLATASPSPGSSAPPTAPPSATPSTTSSAGSSPAPSPAAPESTRAFVVDLFDEGESNITPGNGSALEALGTASAGGPPAGSIARDELWFPLALLALLVLLLEWIVYERDGLVRLQRAVAARRDALVALMRRPGTSRG